MYDSLLVSLSLNRLKIRSPGVKTDMQYWCTSGNFYGCGSRVGITKTKLTMFHPEPETTKKKNLRGLVTLNISPNSWSLDQVGKVKCLLLQLRFSPITEQVKFVGSRDGDVHGTTGVSLDGEEVILLRTSTQCRTELTGTETPRKRLDGRGSEGPVHRRKGDRDIESVTEGNSVSN